MMNDKRKGPRRPLRYTAWVSLGPDKLHGCVLADISDSGAKLEFESAEEIPEQFVLFLSARGKPKRKCRVVWRDDTHLGVEFERPLAAADKTRPILKAEQMAPPPPPPQEEPAEVVDVDVRENAVS
jgi:hypothetical protein